MDDSTQAWKAFAASALPLVPVLIRQMNAVTQETEAAATQLMTKLQAISQRAMKQAEAAAHLIEQATGSPGEDAARWRASADETRQAAVALSGDVSQIDMALQFQDITRQKLEHVQYALTQVRDHLQHLVDGKPDEDLRDSLALLNDLEHRYTMNSERRIHAASQPGGGQPVPATAAGEDEDSVTLF